MEEISRRERLRMGPATVPLQVNMSGYKGNREEFTIQEKTYGPFWGLPPAAAGEA